MRLSPPTSALYLEHLFGRLRAPKRVPVFCLHPPPGRNTSPITTPYRYRPVLISPFGSITVRLLLRASCLGHFRRYRRRACLTFVWGRKRTCTPGWFEYFRHATSTPLHLPAAPRPSHRAHVTTATILAGRLAHGSSTAANIFRDGRRWLNSHAPTTTDMVQDRACRRDILGHTALRDTAMGHLQATPPPTKTIPHATAHPQPAATTYRLPFLFKRTFWTMRAPACPPHPSTYLPWPFDKHALPGHLRLHHQGRWLLYTPTAHSPCHTPSTSLLLQCALFLSTADGVAGCGRD